MNRTYVLIYGEDTLILSMETRIDPPGNSPKNYPACWEYFREELQKTIPRPFAKPIIGRVWVICIMTMRILIPISFLMPKSALKKSSFAATC
jgi:hypothetical protein